MQPPNKQIIFLVDTSASMGVTDGFGGLSRLDSVKAIIDNLQRHLEGQVVSLYTFSQKLSLVVPPTLDPIFMRIAVHNLHIHSEGSGGTDLKDALNEFLKEIHTSSQGKQTDIFFFTDGGDSSKESWDTNNIPTLHNNNIHLFTVGMGSSTPQIIPHVTFEGHSVSSQLDEDFLKKITQELHGKLYIANQWNAFDLSEILYKNITYQNEHLLQSGSTEGKITNLLNEESSAHYFQFPLAIAILFYFMNLLLGDSLRSQKIGMILLLFFPLFPSYCEEEGSKSDLSWHTERTTYNKALLAIQNDNPQEALKLLNEINVPSLRLPRFQRDQLIAEAIAYFEYAKTIPLPPPTSFEAALIFIHFSQTILQKAFEIEKSLDNTREKPSRLIQMWQAAVTHESEIINGQKEKFEKSIKPSQNEDPKAQKILQALLKEAEQSLILFLKYYLDNPIASPIEAAQNGPIKIVKESKNFFTAVLEEQEIAFNKNKECQNTPYAVVLPKFAQGLIATQETLALIETKAASPSKIIALQMAAVSSFYEALKNMTQRVPQNIKNENKTLENYEHIQEMFLQDQTPITEENIEIHAW